MQFCVCEYIYISRNVVNKYSTEGMNLTNQSMTESIATEKKKVYILIYYILLLFIIMTAPLLKNYYIINK